MRFLLIEDNADLARSIIARLELEGHPTDHAASLADAQDHLAVMRYDLILLDITLPDGDGRDFLTRHRASEAQTPVIVLTARSAVSDRVDTLDLGADDYITKPFDFAELQARCRAVLRRQGGSAPAMQSLGGLTFDALGGCVIVGGEARDLRNRELRLLEALMSAPGRILSKDQLCDRLFSLAEAASDNAIEVQVARLRKKIEGSGARIETVRGLGYRLTVA